MNFDAGIIDMPASTSIHTDWFSSQDFLFLFVAQLIEVET